MSLNRYLKSHTLQFHSVYQSDTAFLIIPGKDNIKIDYGIIYNRLPIVFFFIFYGKKARMFCKNILANERKRANVFPHTLQNTLLFSEMSVLFVVYPIDIILPLLLYYFNTKSFRRFPARNFIADAISFFSFQRNNL